MEIYGIYLVVLTVITFFAYGIDKFNDFVYGKAELTSEALKSAKVQKEIIWLSLIKRNSFGLTPHNCSNFSFSIK